MLRESVPKKLILPPADGGSPGKACRDPPWRAGGPRPCQRDRAPAPACGRVSLPVAARLVESGQGSYRPLERLVAVHRAAEPAEVRRVLPEDCGYGLAPVLAEGHQGLPGVEGHGHGRFPPLYLHRSAGGFLGEIPGKSPDGRGERHLKAQTPAFRGGVSAADPRRSRPAHESLNET